MNEILFEKLARDYGLHPTGLYEQHIKHLSEKYGSDNIKFVSYDDIVEIICNLSERKERQDHLSYMTEKRNILVLLISFLLTYEVIKDFFTTSEFNQLVDILRKKHLSRQGNQGKPTTNELTKTSEFVKIQLTFEKNPKEPWWAYQIRLEGKTKKNSQETIWALKVRSIFDYPEDGNKTIQAYIRFPVGVYSEYERNSISLFVYSANGPGTSKYKISKDRNDILVYKWNTALEGISNQIIALPDAELCPVHKKKHLLSFLNKFRKSDSIRRLVREHIS